MARSLRMQNDGGWYHMINRGIDRSNLYREERDRKHFLELLETASVMDCGAVGAAIRSLIKRLKKDRSLRRAHKHATKLFRFSPNSFDTQG